MPKRIVTDRRNCQPGETKTRKKSKALNASLTLWFSKTPRRSREARLDPSTCWEIVEVLLWLLLNSKQYNTLLKISCTDKVIK